MMTYQLFLLNAPLNLVNGDYEMHHDTELFDDGSIANLVHNCSQFFDPGILGWQHEKVE